MKKLFLLSLIPFLGFAADFEQGFLTSESGQFYIQNKHGKIKILTSELIKTSLPSLEKPSFVVQSNGIPYAYEFKGKRLADAFELEQVPTNIPGAIELRGVLQQQDGKYFIGDKEARFGYTKNLNGYEFDEISKQYYVGKELWIEGDYDQDGVFVMQSLSPADLLSATSASFQDKAKDFVLKEMPKN